MAMLMRITNRLLEGVWGRTSRKVTAKSVLDPFLCLAGFFPLCSLLTEEGLQLEIDCFPPLQVAWYGPCFDLPIGPFPLIIAFNLSCSFTMQANVSLNLQINQALKSACFAFHTHCLSGLCSLISSLTNSPPLYPERLLEPSSFPFSVPPGTLSTPPRPTISISVSTCSLKPILLCSATFQSFLGPVFHLERVRLLWEITKNLSALT